MKFSPLKDDDFVSLKRTKERKEQTFARFAVPFYVEHLVQQQ
jgi:hypothetical protein